MSACDTHRAIMVELRRLPIVAGILVAVLSAGAAEAQSTACGDLAQQLNELNRRPSSYNPYTDAIQRQQEAIDHAESYYQRNCQQGFFAQPSQNCGVISDRISQMQANLAKLQRAAPRAGMQGSDGRRERILAQMQRYRCDDQRQPTINTYDRPPPGSISVEPRRGPVETPSLPNGRIFVLPSPNGPMAYREDPGGRVTLLGPADRIDPAYRRAQRPQQRGTISVSPDDDDEDQPADDETRGDETPSHDFSGSYKTLCVRTCDGFYFPISYSVNRNQFQTDADVCHARCPQAETRLFVVRSGATDDGEQSYAADNGQPYSKLPNALRYRREVVQGCTCGALDPSLMPTTGLNPDDVAADAANKKKAAAQSELPQPKAKPTGGEDPETLANAAIGFVPQVIQPVTAAAVPAADPANPTATPGTGDASTPDPKRTVRIVGPKFYADR